jgi:hypothetical protein
MTIITQYYFLLNKYHYCIIAIVDGVKISGNYSLAAFVREAAFGGCMHKVWGGFLLYYFKLVMIAIQIT